MDLEVVSRKENVLLGRIEIEFKISHPGGPSPSRNDIRDEVANAVNSKKDRVVIDNTKTVFGKAETIGYAKIYDKPESAKNVERDHILVRNKIIEKKGKDKDKNKK